MTILGAISWVFSRIKRRIGILPLDVLGLDIIGLEILPRLPLKTILRLKSVNKFFYDYISSKEFINYHLHQPVSSKTGCLVLVLTALIDGQNCLYLVDVDDDNVPDSSPRPRPRPRYLSLPAPFSYGNLTVVGSCHHGLLCLSRQQLYNNEKIANWLILNPSTGTLSNVIIKSYETHVQICSGFGYDNLNDDYKLVVVEYYLNNRRLAPTRKVRLYSMKTGSWSLVECKTIGESEARLPITESKKCVVLGNHLMHWLLRHAFDQSKAISISCFNLESRRWGSDIALPKDYANIGKKYNNNNGNGNGNADRRCYYLQSLELGVFNDCLCLSCYYIYERFFNVWIMKEYGVEESWTEIWVELPEYCYDWYPFIPVEKGSLVLEEILFTKKKRDSHRQWGDETYVVYNIRDKTRRELELRSVPRTLAVQSLCLGSLVTDFGAAQTD